ncbi:GTPase HflX [Amorphus coralli]|uniref:GTPase HflX n=1 Tax=Amorphus coralli TaxID=340680 RepID=UPI0003639B9A
MEHRPPETSLTTRPAPDGVAEGTGARTRALVILPDLKQPVDARAASAGSPVPERSPDARLEEAIGLALAIDLDVVASGIVKLATQRPATLFGTGKVEELKLQVTTAEASLVVVDYPLSPVQQRNLERAWGVKVLDRTALILEIFGDRANTREGALQVELAHLQWQKSRLVRSWTHLERQRGGYGFLGGPGETQIEADRRQIQERITRLERDLEDVRRTRSLHRKKRSRMDQPVVALVGYTNAGKSTLFNRLTHSEVRAQDLLFATLDPTLRRVKLPHGMEIVLSDTVGFISDLPTHLVAAFRATLEEVVEADLILHVRDIAHPDTAAQASDVEATLAALGIDAQEPGRLIEVWNKIDLLGDAQRERMLAETGTETVAVSALTGLGVDRLLDTIEGRLTEGRREAKVSLPSEDGELLAWLYRTTEVLERVDKDDTIRLTVRIPHSAADRFQERAGAYVIT